MQHYLAHLDSVITHYPNQLALADIAGDDARQYTFTELAKQIERLDSLFDV